MDSFDTGPCLRFPQQAQFHPLNYLNGLLQVVQKNGGRIFSRTQAARIEGGSQAWVETKEGWVVLADAVVVATNRPVNDRAAIHTRLAPCRTYVIGVRVPPGSAPRALYWDTADPCHYARVHHIPVGRWSQEAYDLLILGGEDHHAGQAVDGETRWARLEEWARTRFPMICGVEYRWSGQVREPIDGLAFIGPNPMDKPNVYIAACNPVSGMIHGPIAGRLLTDLICGRENKWAELYDPRRTIPSAPPNISPLHTQHRRATRRFDEKRRERFLG
jgi:glycine/D-amino acid oxidase-like deaminating enzyme